MEAPRTIESVPDLLRAIEEVGAAFGREPWWRGQGAAAWPLVAGVHRSRRTLREEQVLAIRFVQRAQTRHYRCPDYRNLPGWLFLMQHYRLPTRLLDWTESPLIAAYFTVTDHPEQDGALWALSPYVMNEVQNGDRVTYNVSSPKVVPLIGQVFGKGISGTLDDMAAIVANEVDQRMLVQLSAFTIHGTGRPVEAHPEAAQFLRKFVVPARAKRALTIGLRRLGVRESSVFPDLEHLAKELAVAKFEVPPDKVPEDPAQLADT